MAHASLSSNIETSTDLSFTIQGRGLLDESASGPVWLVGTSVEHHVKYEYQFVNAQNVFAGQVSRNTSYDSTERR